MKRLYITVFIMQFLWGCGNETSSKEGQSPFKRRVGKKDKNSKRKKSKDDNSTHTSCWKGSIKEFVLKKDAPSWQRPKKGINIKAYCRNKSCERFNDWQWILHNSEKLNFGLLQHDYYEIKCLSCGAEILEGDLPEVCLCQCKGKIEKVLLKDPNLLPKRGNLKLIEKNFCADKSSFIIKLYTGEAMASFIIEVTKL